MSNILHKPELDDEPVYYCRSCHSLKILVNEHLASEGWDGAYCGDCSSTDIGQTSIEDWLAEEERRRKLREKIEWNK